MVPATLRTDFLVLGSGIAGLRAAIGSRATARCSW
jgi:succinate dehydrogenase/fumarate reductase flavoprotein subunit